MKLLVTTIITLGAAVGFVLLTAQDPGYVVLARAPYVVRMPLALFVLAVAAGFAALYLLFNLLAGVLRAPGRLRQWREQRGRASAQFHTVQGYAGLIEGDWPEAERQLLSKLEYNQLPLLNYLGAAYSAQQQGHLRRRDRYLDEALERHPKQRLAISLTRARLHCQAGEIPAAREVLEKLRPVAPRSVPAARLLADLYRDQQDWQALAMLMPTLARLRAFPPEQLAERRREAYVRYLGAAGAPQRGRPAQRFKSLPGAAQKDPAVIAGYCAQLIAAGEHIPAEKTLRKALNRRWDAKLANLYGRAETPFVDDQIKLAESWAKKYGSHPDLTLTLARLYRRARQFEKARGLFMRAIAEGAPDPARAELGSLLEDLGDKDAALRCYRQGLTALTPPTPPGDAEPLPAPDAPPPQGDDAGVMPAVR